MRDTQSEGQRGLRCGARWLDLSQPCVMGILNVTPDSFSDGGKLFGTHAGRAAVSVTQSIEMAAGMVADGARLLDVGGESTRPGAAVVSVQEELDRVLPVVEALATRFDAIVSVDTSTPAVIEGAARLGAGMVNDIRALTRPGALDAAVASDMAVCLMHMQGDLQTMQAEPHYQDVVGDVFDYLQLRLSACLQAGIAAERLTVDPGFGFGKTVMHNYQLLQALARFAQLEVPLLVGMSRKSMIGKVVDRPVGQRVAGSVAAAVLAVERGADIIRVHDVRETMDALKVVAAMKAVEVRD